jgi:mannose-6-phosphate isomerase
LIAVKKQLSVQVHPNKKQAEEGYKSENEEGLFFNAPTRNYKDENHKPEIICAITPFSLMAGFRDCGSIYKSFEELSVKLPQLKEIINPLLKTLEKKLLAVFFRLLYNFSKMELDYISNIISNTEEKNCDHITPEQWRMMKNFSLLYPGDSAVLSPLYLNIIHLSPFQAVFVPSGTLHSYTSGFGVELMAASDNVLRGGLTPKYVNISKFVSIIDYNSCIPDVLTPDESPFFFYKTPCDEFSLAVMRGSGGKNNFPIRDPAICIVTEGELHISGLQTDDLIFYKGQSFFIPGEECERTVSFSGNYSLFAAASRAAYAKA